MSITVLGVRCVVFENTTRITIASASMQYTMRQFTFSSRTRSSCTPLPMAGMGRECGSASNSPRCKRRSKAPASTRAVGENGGVLISPCNQTSGLSRDFIESSICQIGHILKLPAAPRRSLDESKGGALDVFVRKVSIGIYGINCKAISPAFAGGIFPGFVALTAGGRLFFLRKNKADYCRERLTEVTLCEAFTELPPKFRLPGVEDKLN